jgi:hypothetical protein
MTNPEVDAALVDAALVDLERDMTASMLRALLEAPILTYEQPCRAFAKMMTESYRHVLARHTAWSPYAFGGWT